MTDADAHLLAEALDVPVVELAPVSREPLGGGAVAGFHLSDGALAYVDTSLLPVAEETGLALEGVARVWMHPADPHLPALAPAAFGHAAEVLLHRLGMESEGMPAFVGYRPGRRAVLRVPLRAGGAAWVKVVRPRRVERIAHVHDTLRRAGLPVPEVRGWSPEGLLVLAAADGAPATEGEWDAAGLLDAVDDLRARLRDVPLDGDARTSLAARLPWYVEGLIRAFPARAAEISATAVRCAPALATEPTASETIHGDLHLGQLFLAGGAVSGLIDVDTAGRGFAGDDASAFIAHAIASALLTAEGGGDASPVWNLADRARERWAGDERTRALISVHLFGHALGAAMAGATERAGALLKAAATAGYEPKRPLTPAFEGP